MLNNYQITADGQEEPTLRKCISLVAYFQLIYIVKFHFWNTKDSFNIFLVIFRLDLTICMKLKKIEVFITL